jgi:enoyl-CoA hydratase
VQGLLNTSPGAQSILKRVLACDASALIDSLAGGYLVASGETNSRRNS